MLASTIGRSRTRVQAGKDWRRSVYDISYERALSFVAPVRRDEATVSRAGPLGAHMDMMYMDMSPYGVQA